MNWKPDGEDDEAPAKRRTRHPSWLLPPMDLLVGAGAGRRDGAARQRHARQPHRRDAGQLRRRRPRRCSTTKAPSSRSSTSSPGWEIKYTHGGRARQGRQGRSSTRTAGRRRAAKRSRAPASASTRSPAWRTTSRWRWPRRRSASRRRCPAAAVVGIEVPNTTASVVTLRSVIETPAFQRLAAKSKLALPLGKSVSGEPVVADLAKMPHLLIAGATGSGKSVCINSIIASILMQSRPEEVRFVMIDPKRVELAGFAHDPAPRVLEHRRRHGEGRRHARRRPPRDGGALQALRRARRAQHRGLQQAPARSREQLPYWVVIIDELADLMMAAPFEVERQICRLAQLARATGIHLIVATQRPSVDVITGLIKANFPTRIAFAVSSQVDSRTILDMAGAEKLLGRGDMLYMPTDASKPKRVQGVYVSDAGDRPHRRLLGAAARHALDAGLRPPARRSAGSRSRRQRTPTRCTSGPRRWPRSTPASRTSMLQRRLRIGYPRAARIMDRLEEEGYVRDGGSTSRELYDEINVRDDESDLPGFKAPF